MKFRKIIFGLVAILLLSACGDSAENKEQVLNVYYYIDGSNQIERAIDTFEKNNNEITVNRVGFEDGEEMQLKVSSNISGDEKADVYLFNYRYTDLDKLVASGSLEPLDEYIENDESFNKDMYYTPVLETGIYNDTRYVLPLNFNLNVTLASNYTLEQRQIDMSNVNGFSDYIDVVSADIERGLEEPTNYSVMSFARLSQANYMRCSGIDFMYINNKTVNFADGRLREISDFCKLFYENEKHKEDVKAKLSHDSMNYSNSTFIVEPVLLPFWPSFYGACYKGSLGDEQGVNMYALPSYDNSEEYVATISMFGAVNSNSDMKQAGYELVKTVMNTAGYENTDAPNSRKNSKLSPNKEINKIMLNEATKSTRDNTTINNKKVYFEPLSLEDKEYIENIYNNIGKAVIPNYNIDNIIDEVMTKFYEDEMSYEDCIAELENRVSIYLNE